MNTAGPVLDVDGANNLAVRAILHHSYSSEKRNIHPGYQIIEIDGGRQKLWKITDASDALSGPVGAIKRLLIGRDGKEIQTTAVVAHLL